ncbi:MAG: dienelactone hydrolase family protein [Polyangiaceae bacterium]
MMWWREGGALLVALGLWACSGDAVGPGDPSSSSSGTGAGQGTTGGSTGVGGDGFGGMPASGAGGVGAGGDPGVGGGATTVDDPDQDGPYTTATIAGVESVSATGHDVAVHCAYPTGGPTAAPYPVVLVGHGFQIAPSQYASYVQRLASHGYVAMTVDFVAGFTSSNNVAQATELLAGLDWAEAEPSLAGLADTSLVGTTGHSLGGKVAVLAAVNDARVKATIALDPVDSSMNCSPTNCPDVSALLPIAKPTAFLGETIDATGTFQACAPAADNFETFYANAATPSLKVHLLGANHVGFVDDVNTCGFACSFCNPASESNAVVNALSRAYVVAFFQRHLRGEVAYDDYLTGSQAQARYVTTGIATIESK